jgi:hypothetical protein
MSQPHSSDDWSHARFAKSSFNMAIIALQKSMIDKAHESMTEGADILKNLSKIVHQSLLQGICAPHAQMLRTKLLGPLPTTRVLGLDLDALLAMCQQHTGESLEALLTQVCALSW